MEGYSQQTIHMGRGNMRQFQGRAANKLSKRNEEMKGGKKKMH